MNASDSRDSKPSFQCVAMAAITALAAILRLIGIRRSLWFDEGFSLLFAQTSGLWDSILKIYTLDVHPPLYYLLLKIWIDVFGASPLSIRMPSVLSGCLAVWLLHRLALRFDASPRSLIPPFLLAVSPVAVHYSGEARFYPFLTMLLIIWALLLTGREISKRRIWVAFAVALALSFMQGAAALYVVPLWIASAAISLRVDRRDSRAWITATALLLVATIPWLIRQALVPAGRLTHIAELDAGGIDDLFMKLLFYKDNRFKVFNALFFGSMGLGLAGSILSVRETARKLLLAWAALPPMICFMASLIRPMYSLRSLLFMQGLVAALLMMSSGHALWKRRAVGYARDSLTAALVVGAIIVAAFQIAERKAAPQEEWEQAAHFLQMALNRGDPMIVASAYAALPLMYYFNGKNLDGLADRFDSSCDRPFIGLVREDPVSLICDEKRLENISADRSEVLLIRSHSRTDRPSWIKESDRLAHAFRGIEIRRAGVVGRE